jgi:hypothetical protein
MFKTSPVRSVGKFALVLFAWCVAGPAPADAQTLTGPVLISTQGVLPKTASGGNGVIYVVYEGVNPVGGGDVRFRRSGDGGLTWSADVVLSAPPFTSSGAFPQIAANGDEIYVSWAHNSGLNVTSSHDGGATWAVPQQVSASFGLPTIAIGSPGHAAFTWRSDSVVITTDGGQSYSAPMAVSASDAIVALGMSPADDLFLLSYFGKFSRVDHSDQSVTTQQLTAPSYPSDMFVDAGGNVNVVWTVYNAISFVRSTDNGFTFSTPVTVATVPNAYGSGLWQPRVVADAHGNITVVSGQSSGSHDTSNAPPACSLNGQGTWRHTLVSYSSHDGGATFGPPVTVDGDLGFCNYSEFAVGFAYPLRVSLDTDGGLHVVSVRSSNAADNNQVDEEFLSLRRSLDHGATFSSPIDLSQSAYSVSFDDSPGTLVPYPDVQLVPGSPTMTAVFWLSSSNTAVGLFFARVAWGNTGAGSNVAVQPVDSTTGNPAPISLTFSNVTSGGTTTVTSSTTGTPPPSGFKLGSPPTYFEITTTATFSGVVHLCIDYSGVSYSNPLSLKLMHLTGGSWVDVTTSNNTTTHVICGNTTSFSPFAVFEAQYVATVQAPIAASGSTVFAANRGAIPVKFTVTFEGTATCQLPPATITVTRTVGPAPGPVNEASYMAPSDDGSNFRISGCQYVYNLSAGPLGPGTYLIQIVIGGAPAGSATFALR